MKIFSIRGITIATMLSLSFLSHASVIISEIMPGNISTYRNKEKEYTGWVEFYNDGKDDVNIKGWNITNYQKKSKNNSSEESIKWSWDIDFDITIPAGGYKVVSFDNYEPLPHTSAKEKHAPYKVEPEGGILELNSPKGESFSLKYPSLKPHLSYGVYGEEESEAGHMVPSPNEKNNSGYETLKQCAKPEFTGVKPGVNNKGKWPSQRIKVSCATEGAYIRYTLDGSTPTEDSKRFKPDTTKLDVDTIKVFRARAFKGGYLPSDILTGSFITYSEKRDECSGENPPVVSIVTDAKFLSNDEIGIHCVGTSGIPGPKGCIANSANYNQAWKRAVNFEYFVDGEQKLSQEAMIGIIGGCSRKYDVKSLKINTSKRLGSDIFDYDFFKDNDKKGQKYSSLQLRNGGNGYETMRFRDGFIQSIAKDIDNLDYQAYQPVSYYLNGKYKGLMGLRERTNGSYIEANYGIDEDKIDLIEMSESKIEAALGDLNAYNEMIAFATDSNNYKKDNYVAQLSNYMDVEEYINYMIFEQFIVNTDWPGNNQKCWRKHIGGKFRWILYDTDFALGLYGWGDNNFCDASLNTIKWCTGEGNEHNWANASSTGNGYEITEESKWKTILFKSLMKNEGFRNMFATKALQHLYTTFDEDVLKEKAKAFKPLVSKEHCATKKADMPGVDSSDGGIDGMLSFANSRRSKYKEDLASYCKFNKDEKTTLYISCKGDFADKIKGFTVNDVVMNEQSVKIRLFRGMNVNIKPILPNGYIVKEWEMDTIKSPKYAFNTKLQKDTVKVKLTIQEESYDKPTIVINEVCAKSSIFIDPESNEGEDWIELYNTGTQSVDVAGFFLKDKDTTVEIARGYEMTNIPPKGHLLLWADGRGKSGAQHLGFKLSSTGEELTLYKDVRDSIIVVDNIKFNSIGEDCSYGRETDGSSSFKVFSVCSEHKEFSEATPGESNGIYDCQNVIEMRTYPVDITCDFPTMRYKINGEIKDNPLLDYRVLKGKTITVTPVLPQWVGFIAWELSTFVESSEEIINKESRWTYHHADSAPSGKWKELNYDDSEWEKDAHGYMGYDASNKDRGFKYDTDIPFVKGDSAKFITAYFRHVFTIEDTAGMKSFTANVTYDDGVAIYLNGVELGRYNLPKDSAHAELAYGDTTLNYYDDQRAQIEIKPSMFKKGKNIFAAEVHQINSATSDMTFALDAKAKFTSHICKEETFTVTPKEKFTAKLYVSGHTNTKETRMEDPTSEFTLYPNPTENLVYVQGCKEKALVTVTNQLGGMVIMQYISGEDDPIDLQKMADGTYIFNVTTGTKHFVGKIIKK